MGEKVEFFSEGSDVWYHDKDGMHLLTQSSPSVSYLIDSISDLYPSAYNALCECYSKSRLNVPLFRYKVACRFCKCNFGSLDHTRKDIDDDAFNFERVSCPLHGECQYEGIICMPKMDTRLSDAERRVMKLVYDGLLNQEIAEKLSLSMNTVKRHVSNALLKTRTRNRVEFVKYANRISLFNK